MADMKMQMSLELKARLDDVEKAKQAIKMLDDGLSSMGATLQNVTSNIETMMKKLTQLSSIKIPDITAQVTPKYTEPTTALKSVEAISKALNQIPPPVITPTLDLKQARFDILNIKNKYKKRNWNLQFMLILTMNNIKKKKKK